jgi:uncharacterized membrane protein YkvI
MKKTLLKVLAIIICVLVFFGLVVYIFFFDIDAIKPGEKITESTSPSGKYKITAYLNNGGATVDFAVLCVLSDGKHRKNIYWNYHCVSADIEWIDDDTVIINGVKLEDVNRDAYDFRRE